MAATPIKTWLKDPNAVLDFTVGWGNWLGPNDSISATPTVTADSGITVDSSTYSGDTVTIWLSGGTDGTTYNVAVKIVTAGGRTDERTFAIRVASR